MPRQLGGADQVENLVLLCKDCHRDSPDSADPTHLLQWIVSGPSGLARANARFAPEFERYPEGMLDDLARVGDDVLDRYLREELASYGTHGFEVSTGTVAQALRAVHHRLDSEGAIPPSVEERSQVERTDKGIALYHRIWQHETFHDAVKVLFRLLRWAEDEWPGAPRHLYLDIDGHRNDAGGFDTDMYELQFEFVTKFLSRFLTTFGTPLSGGRVKVATQHNDVPEYFIIVGRGATGRARASVRAEILATRLSAMT